MLDLTLAEVTENDGQVSDQIVEQNGGQVSGDSKESFDPFNGEDPTSKISCKCIIICFTVCHANIVLSAKLNSLNSVHRSTRFLPHDAQSQKYQTHLC